MGAVAALSEWRQAMAEMEGTGNGNPIVAVCGPKGMGKSVFCRLLANGLLSAGWRSVLHVDLDCGQAEFTPPGIVSLRDVFHPICSPPQLSEASADPVLSQIFAGGATPKNDPDLYKFAVRRLAASCTEELRREKKPVVINTMGWVKGLGVDLLSDALREFKPSSVVSIAADSPAKSLDSEDVSFALHPRCRFVVIQGFDGRKDAADERSARWQVWCAQSARGRFDVPVRREKASYEAAARALCSCPCFCVSVNRVSVSATGGRQLGKTALLAAASGKPVGLTRGDSTGECLGLGLGRSVDFRRGVVSVVAPLSEERMKGVRELVVGDLELPLLLLRPGAGLNSPYVSHHGIQTLGTGAKAKRSRTDLMRRSHESGQSEH